ncbi:hydantoinase/oxoprolinase N-terminal domain-containing protein [Nonomuraea dietziae]|uniref:hydantoinase/oxoprolinase N-terminal domain-containing protein n=1 Tax=Nonomuraea dietziae TaxID=65515 RepID=UPI0031E1B3BD
MRIGVDTGGTFTDVVAVDERTGEIFTTKTPSTPANPADGFMAASEGRRREGGRGGHPGWCTAPRWPPTNCSRTGSRTSGS